MESFTFFHTFGPLDAPLVFRIQPRANMLQGYSLLQLHRPLMDSVGWSLPIFRLSAVAYGWISLLLFFTIAKRYFGLWPGLMAMLLLALNPVFLTFQNNMSVVVVTFMCILWMTERLQRLELEPDNTLSLVLFGIACAFALIHYSMSRYVAVLLTLFYFFRYWILHTVKFGYSSPLPGNMPRQVTVFFAAFVDFLFSLHPKNLLDLLQPKTIFFPVYSEAVDITGPILATLDRNFKIAFESLFFPGHTFHSPFSSDLLFDYKFPMVHSLILPFFLIGLGYAFWNTFHRSFMTRTPFLLVNLLFGFTFLAPLFSKIPSHGPGTTLSAYRMFFVLLPVYLYVAIACKLLFEWLQKKNFPVVRTAVFVVLFILFQTIPLIQEKIRITEYIDRVTAPPEFSFENAFPKVEYYAGVLKGPQGDVDKGWISSDHWDDFKLHLTLLSLRRKIIKSIKNSGKAQSIRIFQVDLDRFSGDNKLKPASVHWLGGLNFHTVFLALYLADRDVDVGFAQMLPPGRLPFRMWGNGYTGPARVFSARMKLVEDKLHYIDPGPLDGEIRFTGNKNTRIFLATNPQERQFLEKNLRDRHENVTIEKI